MKELFFKVIIAESIDVPLSAKEMRLYPTYSMYLAQYHEKLINVMYNPANGFDKDKFVKMIIRKLALKYKTTDIELVEHQKKLP
jgi:hypothetical protein